ncbi:MAG: ATP-dependent sacrificial sulfur transferase LarE [Candidatus Binatia bacterium]|nr:ATP-dependent sacrificial sulfur transferase LarE [Candidatus Binatia bacterium]
MTELETKFQTLRHLFAEYGQVLVAFSGGVDSSFVLRVAHDVLDAKVVALTVRSPTVPEYDHRAAVELAQALGVEHIVVDADELEIPEYAANPTNRCYFCKQHLFEICSAEASRRGIPIIVDGANLDDLGDYRPGLKAAAERGVRHPLVEAGLRKADVRELSRRLGLPTWSKPASPCLSSRFPYGTRITHEALQRVARAEQVLHDLGFRVCRVRYHQKLARIEVPLADLPRLLEPEIRACVVEGFRAAGFEHVTVDLEGFRSGSLNEVLGLVAKKQ